MLDAGALDQAAYDGWIGMCNGMYNGNAQLQRDEAIRSGSLAAMTLMYAAQAKGYVSGAMIGFDGAAVAKEFGLNEHEVPVMLIAVGNAAPGNWPRKVRRSLAQAVKTV
jgi:nitroreductase